MAYALSIRLLAEPLRSLAFGAIGAAYMGIGTSLANPCRILNVQNLTDASLLFSMDGVTDHFVLPANGFILLDISANEVHSGGWFISQGQRFYAKTNGVVPTTGAVYLSAFYGE